MRNANYYLKSYFQAKFMMKPFASPLPQLSHPSYILNDELLFQLLLSSKNTVLQHSYRLELIYSNIANSKVDFD